MSRSDARLALTAAGLLVATAACVAFSGLHRYDNSDNLVPVLMSLQKWTPFFWDQARVGALNALLAIPVRHPLSNLLLQTGLAAFWALLSLFLLTSQVRRVEVRLAAGAAAAALLLLCLPPFEVFRLFMHHYEYGTSLALGAAGLWALEGDASRRRLAAGVLLLGLSLWVNLSVAFALVPLHLARCALLGREAGFIPRLLSGPALRTTLVLAVLFGLNVLLIRGMGLERYELVSLDDWLQDPARLGVNGARAFLSQGLGLALGGVLLLGVAATAYPAGRAALRPAARAAVPLLVAAGVYLPAMVAIGHMAGSAEARYAMAALLLVVTAVTAFTATVLDAVRPGWTRPAALLLLLVLPLAVARVDGLLSRQGVQAVLERGWGGYAREADQGRCTHIGGPYWTVWPMVYLITTWRQDEGRTLPIFGVTQRCEPTRPQWARVAPEDMRLALFRSSASEFRRMTKSSFWPLRRSGESASFIWWRRADQVR